MQPAELDGTAGTAAQEWDGCCYKRWQPERKPLHVIEHDAVRSVLVLQIVGTQASHDITPVAVIAYAYVYMCACVRACVREYV